MFVDVIGIILTVLIVSPRYWFIVLFISSIELLFTIFFSMVLQGGVTEVIAGGIFSWMARSNGTDIIQLFCPFLFFMLGLGALKNTKIFWLDLLNPLACFKKPWPVMMIKISILRIAVFLFFFYGN